MADAMIATPEEIDVGRAIGATPWKALVPSPRSSRTTLARLKVFAESVRSAPAHRVVRAAERNERTGPWALYFVFTPSGAAYAQHRYTLERLRSQGFAVLAVVASASADERWWTGFDAADALIVKATPGFDFSGYAIGLAHLVAQLGRVDVAVLNDSVFGPFSDLRALLARTPWWLTGFTASAAIENHLQSYAFLLKELDGARLRTLRRVLWRGVACDRHQAVTFLQEARLGRVALDAGPVGAIWTPDNPRFDLTMAHPLQLLEAGFPFVKRSLLGKFAADFDTGAVTAALTARGHPVAQDDLFPDLSTRR